MSRIDKNYLDKILTLQDKRDELEKKIVEAKESSEKLLELYTNVCSLIKEIKALEYSESLFISHDKYQIYSGKELVTHLRKILEEKLDEYEKSRKLYESCDDILNKLKRRTGPEDLDLKGALEALTYLIENFKNNGSKDETI